VCWEGEGCMMSHPEFDYKFWFDRLFTNSQGNIDDFDARNMSYLLTDSPIGLLGGEYYRGKVPTDCPDFGKQVPVDQFVFGRGEPPKRHLTKIQGLPYRPRTLPWPTDSSGRPLTFLAQYSFVDSMDHIGKLPGDVLLVFIRNMFEPPYPGISLTFEWYPLGIEDLVMEVPPPELEFPTCYGVRNRSRDFPESSLAKPAFDKLLDPVCLSMKNDNRSRFVEALLRYRGMKIGGSPYWFYPDYVNEARLKDLKFLCGFNGLCPVSEYPYPFVNDKKILSNRESVSPFNQIWFYDGLIINVFIKDDGSLVKYGQFM
jgi:hypothetical protein